MTSKEIAAMREQVTGIYKIAWHEMNEAVHNETKIKVRCGEDSVEHVDAYDVAEHWKGVRVQLGETISDLLHLQCDAAEKELHYAIDK